MRKHAVGDVIEDLITGKERRSGVQTRIYTKQAADQRKTILMQQIGSRLFTSEVTDKNPGSATFITLEQLPGSMSKFTG